eukprot:Trichotokara_eunicae@DN4544_c0_g1_i1.p2
MLEGEGADVSGGAVDRGAFFGGGKVVEVVKSAVVGDALPEEAQKNSAQTTSKEEEKEEKAGRKARKRMEKSLQKFKKKGRDRLEAECETKVSDAHRAINKNDTPNGADNMHATTEKNAIENDPLARLQMRTEDLLKEHSEKFIKSYRKNV